MTALRFGTDNGRAKDRRLTMSVGSV
jgi:hypothetical protein